MIKSKKNVFVIMPFSSTQTCTEEQWLEIYNHIFKPAVEECGYTCERAIPSTGSLIKSIISKLEESSIVLADITDRNANVFYELGVRHSLSKRTIVVSQDPKHIPSDLMGYWAIIYGVSPKEVNDFKFAIKRLISEIEINPEKPDSPISDYLDNKNFNISQYRQKETIKKLNALLTEFSGNISVLRSIVNNENRVTRIIIDDCLRLLLSTYYIDIGTDLLKDAYELLYLLKKVESKMVAEINSKIDVNFCKYCIEKLERLDKAILNIKTQIHNDDFEEPIEVSRMIWQLTLEIDNTDETDFMVCSA